MRCASFRLFVLILPGQESTLFPMKGSGRTGRIQPSGFAAGTNTDGQAHHLLVQSVVSWFFLGHCGPSSKHRVGRGGDCIGLSSCR